MPGPGRSKKTKKPSKGGSGTGRTASTARISGLGGAAKGERNAYVDDVDGADGWTPVVNILCDVFELPDLTTRRGLKKVHANFDTIYKKLENAYATNLDNERIKGGIVGIYSKMAADSLLRNKLYERGLLNKLIPLLQIDSTRRMAFRALVTVTHHGGAEIRAQIATHSPVFTSLLESFAEDEDICEMAVSVLAHAIGAVTEGPESAVAYPKILQTLDMSRILRCVVKATKRHNVSRVLFEHATELVASSALHASRAYDSVPEAVRYLVAGIRCKDWVMRSHCLGGLIRLHKLGSEDDQRLLDPNRLMNAVTQGIPPRINEKLVAYGPTRCELYLSLSTSREFQGAIMEVARDRDMYVLGLRLVKIILTTEFSIPDGYFETINKRTGAREQTDIGLPFVRYAEALPQCAKVLRTKCKPEDADAADILDIKYMLMKNRANEAAKFAQKSLERNPNNAYFYYAVSLSADHTSGLRASKKGIKCKNITPFIRWQLTQRAVEHAGDFGLDVINSSPAHGEHKWEEGIAFLMSAYEDAKDFLDGAPPDNRYMKNVSYWYILLTILIGENLSPDLRELKSGIEKLRFADECSKFMGTNPPHTVLRKTQATAIKLLPEAMKEFEQVFDRGEDAARAALSSEKSNYQDDLAAWLDNLKLDDGEDAREIEGEFGNYKVDTSRIGMYRCSHCGNPSAALRKCSGCTKARYCDSTCQKGHWVEHKKTCRA